MAYEWGVPEIIIKSGPRGLSKGITYPTQSSNVRSYLLDLTKAYLISQSIHSQRKRKTRGLLAHYGLAIYIKKYLKRQKKKNYGNSNISPCKNILIFQKNPLEETKILQDIIITLL
jgi:hypothetical protein